MQTYQTLVNGIITDYDDFGVAFLNRDPGAPIQIHGPRTVVDGEFHTECVEIPGEQLDLIHPHVS